MSLWLPDGVWHMVRTRAYQRLVPAPRNPRLPDVRSFPDRVASAALRRQVRQLQGMAGSMKITLVCTECDERFSISGDMSWDDVTCPGCKYVGNVIGRIMDGERHYFANEDETQVIPKVSDDNPED